MFPAFLIQLIIILVIVGLALWVLAQIPMDPWIAKIIRVIVVVVCAIWLLYVLVGLLGGGLALPPVIRR